MADNFRCEDHNKIYKQLKSARVNTKHVGETGVKRDTGSKGTVGGKILDVNKS
jgi:hypothetical protein